MDFPIQLLKLSRFHTYYPFFAPLIGSWSVLLSSAARLHTKEISPLFALQQTVVYSIFTYIFCGAGNVWNDWVDRDIDRHVARTKSRPLTSGKVTAPQAFAWLAVQLVICYGLLSFMLGERQAWPLFFPLVLGTGLYPYGKRPEAKEWHIYPQYLLGFTFGCTSLTGRAIIYGKSESLLATIWHSLPLGAVIFVWYIYVNTLYSYQDVRDDMKLDLNSLYTAFGRQKRSLMVLLVALTLIAVARLVVVVHSKWIAVSWLGVWAPCLCVQLFQFNPDKPKSGGYLDWSNLLLAIWTMGICIVEVGLGCLYGRMRTDFILIS